MSTAAWIRRGVMVSCGMDAEHSEMILIAMWRNVATTSMVAMVSSCPCALRHLCESQMGQQHGAWNHVLLTGALATLQLGIPSTESWRRRIKLRGTPDGPDGQN